MREEIEKEKVWLKATARQGYDIDIAFNAINHIIDRYMGVKE